MKKPTEPLVFHDGPPPTTGAEIRQWIIASDPDAKLPVLEAVLEEIVDRGWVLPQAIMKARLCIDEGLINAIDHGNARDATKLVTVTLFDAYESWGLSIEDQGPGFSLEDVPDASDPASVLLEGGRGILLMRSLMDDVWYWDNGARVYLRKRVDT
jgi:serine/threonine-protein kinase RsbW